MTRRSATFACLLIAGSVFLGGCVHNPLKVKGGNVYTVVLHVGSQDCFASPQVTHARPGDVLVFFVDEPGSDATISGLGKKPLPPGTSIHKSHVEGEDARGYPLTDQDSMTLDPGHFDKVRISAKAKGMYELNVTCGGKTDDPPKVVVW